MPVATETEWGVGGRTGQRDDLLQVEHIWKEDSSTLNAGLHTMYTRQNVYTELPGPGKENHECNPGQTYISILAFELQ